MAISEALIGTLGSALISSIPTLISSLGSSSSSSSASSTQAASESTSSNWATMGASDSSLASILSALGSTPTGNNSNSAYSASQQSATTANNLQETWMNQANLLNGISNLMANGLSLYNQYSARSYNSKESELTRDWQQMMRQTAYQDTVSDLQAAGLNPVLAAKNGANGNYTGAEANTQALAGIQTAAASIPTAHTATMQAMYDYGNNTTQYLDRALQTIQSAKQYGYENIARSLEQSMNEITSASAKQVSESAKSNEPSYYGDGKADNVIKQAMKDVRATGNHTTGGMDWAD